MSNERHLKFKTYSGNTICDYEHTNDFHISTRFKKIYVGQYGLYHKNLFRYYFIPYSDISGIYKQIQIIPVDDSPAYEHYRIIINGSDGRITEILFGEGFMNRTEDSDTADALLDSIHHLDAAAHIKIGYDENSTDNDHKSIWRFK